MFTTNYRKMMKATLLYDNATATLTAWNGTTFKNYRGNDYSNQRMSVGYALGYAYVLDSTARTNPFVAFGSGKTPPTIDDYTLENPLSGVVHAIGTKTIVDDGETVTVENTFMITNNNSEAITVSEAGIFCAVSESSAESTNTRRHTLMDRVLLSNPITIPPGESGTVKYTLVMQYPS